MSEIKYVCAVCGGCEVQHAMWVSLNDGAVHDDFGSWCNGDNSWCADCEEHVENQDREHGDGRGPLSF